MKRLSVYLGWSGLLLVALGALGYALAPMFPGFYVLPWGLAAGFVFLFLAFHLKEALRLFQNPSARLGAGSLVSVALVLGILIILAVLTARHSWRWDLTGDQRHSLAPQTLNILKGLTQDVRVIGFFPIEATALSPVRELLERYAQVSPHFQFEIVDPDRFPGRAEKAGVTTYNTVLVESGDHSEKLAGLSEEKLTNALLRVTRPGRKTIYFTRGHGEKDLDDQGKTGFSQVKSRLEGQNYEVKTLALMQHQDVPSDAAVVVAAGPQKDFMESETEALGRFLNKGGKALVLLDPQAAPRLASMFQKFNVLIGDDVVIDEESRAYGFDYSAPLVQRYTQHPIIKDLTAFSLFPLARSVSVVLNPAPGIDVVPLALTGEHAWAETNLKQLLGEGSAQYDAQEDSQGNIPLAVVGSIQLAKQEAAPNPPSPQDQDVRKAQGKFIVFGDSDFATNTYLDLVGNSDLFLSSLSWLAEEADLVAVRPKDEKNQPLMLSALQGRIVFWIPAVVVPIFVLMAGILVVASRRKRP